MLSVAQITSLLRIVVVFIGGIAVSKGLVSQEMVERASDTVFLTQVIGGIAAAAAAVYGLYLRRPAGVVDAAAALPDVAKIETYDPALANKTQSHKVVTKD